jgi:hypothetical protein
MGFLDEAPSLETKMSTIEALRTVTEGKVCSLFSFRDAGIDLDLDLRRGRAGPCNPNPLEPQERTGRYQGGTRYPVRASGGDIRIHGKAGED